MTNPVLSWAVPIAMFLLALAMLCCLVRILRGPAAQDRVLAVDFLNIVAMLLMLGWLALLAWGAWAQRLPLWLLGAMAALNLVTFLSYALDKSAAQSGGWRTSEKQLHLLALLGGCVAVPADSYQVGDPVAYPAATYGDVYYAPGYSTYPAPYYYGPPVSVGVYGWSGGRNWHRPPPPRPARPGTRRWAAPRTPTGRCCCWSGSPSPAPVSGCSSSTPPPARSSAASANSG